MPALSMNSTADEVQDDLRFPLTNQTANDVAENHVSFTERDFSPDVHDAHVRQPLASRHVVFKFVRS
jgi:hypothetical protein